MASTRIPKGTYTRGTEDWHVASAASIAGYWSSNPGTPPNIGAQTAWYFQNNSPLGQYLWIYDMQAQGSECILGDYVGGPAGSLIAVGQSVFSDRASQPGNLYLNLGPLIQLGIQNPLAVAETGHLFVAASQVQTGTMVFPRFPFVLAPMNTLRILNDYSVSVSSISIYYLVMPGAP